MKNTKDIEQSCMKEKFHTIFLPSLICTSAKLEHFNWLTNTISSARDQAIAKKEKMEDHRRCKFYPNKRLNQDWNL